MKLIYFKSLIRRANKKKGRYRMVIRLIWIMGPIMVTMYLTLWLLKRFIPIKSNLENWVIPWFNLCVLFLSDFLVPGDIYSQGESGYKYLWFTTYAIQFILCWFLLPCMISYHELNYSIYSLHGPLQQIYGSMIQNVKFYAICGVILVIGFILALMTLSIHSNWPIIISLCHIYSLSFTLTLLAMGLVIVPRDLYQRLFMKESHIINRYYITLSRQNDELNDSKLYLLDHSINILHSKPLTTGDVEFNKLLTNCKDEVKQKLDQLDWENRYNDHLLNDNDDMFTPIKSIDKLNKEWNQFITHFYTIQYHQYQIDKYIHLLAKQSAINIPNNTDTSVNLTYSQSYGQMLHKWGVNILLFTLLVLSIITSISVILLETLPARLTKWVIWNRLSATTAAPILIIILIYNKLISLYAMTIIKFQNFHLTPNGHSNPRNLFYFILYGNRLLFPLYFNLMTFIPAKVYEETQFNKILYNQIKLIPIVNWLNKWLPPIFIILIGISYYNNKLKWQILNKFISEDTLYQIFGWFDLEDYNEENGLSSGALFGKNNNNNDEIGEIDNERLSISTNITNTNDIEYSLQDGRFLFERAINSSNGNRYTDNVDNSTRYNNNVELNETNNNNFTTTAPNLNDYFNNL